jgi:hypothetical protein
MGNHKKPGGFLSKILIKQIYFERFYSRKPHVTLLLLFLFQYGSQDEHGNWNGLIKEVMLGSEGGGADFAIADLSITSSRASAVTFSMPWMNLGTVVELICEKVV